MKNEPIVINGKTYPLWEQFVNKQDEFIGGVLEDFGDSMDRALFGGELPELTNINKITAITLEPNGDDSAYFEVEGDQYSCGFDVGHGGITSGEEGWITFSGYMGHKWRMKKIEE